MASVYVYHTQPESTDTNGCPPPTFAHTTTQHSRDQSDHRTIGRLPLCLCLERNVRWMAGLTAEERTRLVQRLTCCSTTPKKARRS